MSFYVFKLISYLFLQIKIKVLRSIWVRRICSSQTTIISLALNDLENLYKKEGKPDDCTFVLLTTAKVRMEFSFTHHFSWRKVSSFFFLFFSLITKKTSTGIQPPDHHLLNTFCFSFLAGISYQPTTTEFIVVTWFLFLKVKYCQEKVQICLSIVSYYELRLLPIQRATSLPFVSLLSRWTHHAAGGRT